MEFFTLGNGMVTTSSKNCLSASLFKKGLIENVIFGVLTTLLKKGLTENFFKKGLIEKPCNGVINRRNGCGSTVALKKDNFWIEYWLFAVSSG